MTDKDLKRESGTGASPPKPPEAPPPTPPVATVELRTPEEWAAVCGQRRAKTFEETVTMVNGKPFDVVGDFLDRHEAASLVHGWKQHEHHEGAPMKLSRAAYEAALEAGSSTDASGQPVPHKGALSKHAAPQFIAAANGGK